MRQKDSLIVALASGAYVGYLPLCPGTWGSLLGIFPFFICSRLSSLSWIFFLFVFTFLSVRISGQAEIILGKTDDPRIIIDEIVGMAIAMFQIPFTARAIILSFLLFRFFDIFKVFPIGILQRLPGGYGITFDDVMAGIYANVILRLFFI